MDFIDLKVYFKRLINVFIKKYNNQLISRKYSIIQNLEEPINKKKFEITSCI